MNSDDGVSIGFLHVRIGKGDGFSNQNTKKLHDVGTRAMTNTKLCIHENVTEFSEALEDCVMSKACTSRETFCMPLDCAIAPLQDDYLTSATGFKIQKAVLLVVLWGNE